MRITYDKQAKAAYIHLKALTPNHPTLSSKEVVEDLIVLDYCDGEVVGIDLMDVSFPIILEDITAK